MKIIGIKQQIEIERTTQDRYIKTIVRSCFIDNCTGGAYFNDLFNKLIVQGYDILHDSKLKPKKIDELRTDWFPLFNKPKTEVESLQDNLKWEKSLTHWAKYMLTSLSDKKKEEIIKDSMTQQAMWSEQFNRNSKLYKALKK